MPSDADDVLIRLSGQQDEAALSALYDLRGRLIYSLVFGIVRNERDAEEVTQEVFVRVWQKAGTFDRSRGSGLAWLTTITRRLAIDRIRSKHYKSGSREVSLDAPAEGGAVVQVAAVSGESVTIGAETNDVIAALNQLGGPHREVIQLSYFEGLSHSKIASQLNTPLGTVKSRLREAITQLRRILDVDG